MAAMAVQHNMQSINANRLLGITTSQQKKSTEKLSSGYKINRAGDDAAGLAISEKMRGQIRGLDKASTNASDGISLIQTAEGGLNETHSILQRMRELAVQASTDTNTDDDRNQIQSEINQLTQEVDRIATSTEFNTKKLLDGSLTGTRRAQAATASAVGSFANSEVTVSGNFSEFGGVFSSAQAIRIDYSEDGNVKGKITLLHSTGAITLTAADASMSFAGQNNLEVSTDTTLKVDISNSDKIKAGDSLVITLGRAMSTTTEDANKRGLRLQVGANAGQEITLGISSMRARDLSISNKETGDALSVKTQAKASVAIEAYDEAIKTVSGERAKLGSVQNRLEHTIDNLNSASENTQSAESGIRDTDMASEMVTHSKNNILAQAGQSMLAQANQSTQGVLSLLG